MVSRGPRICDSCVHPNADARGYFPKHPTCAAYPDGIPMDIWGGVADHREFRGDETVRLKHCLDPDKIMFLEIWDKFQEPWDG